MLLKFIDINNRNNYLYLGFFIKNITFNSLINSIINIFLNVFYIKKYY